MLAWGVCPGEETIAAFVAGRLPRAERDGVDSHLDTCTSCQELVAMLAKLQPVRDTTAPATLAEQVAETQLAGRLGRYVLHARLGAGGMGVVYAAYDPELDRRVALKVLRHTQAGEQLRDEARAIAKLAHPNVIAVHDVGEADGELFIAMEHVEGVTLREWLREQRTPAEILDVFVQAGRGLAAAHRAGLVHRDVKPSNIIVGADGRARVLDFGLARDDRDEAPAVVGTPAYMAPEQRRGERVDARADQYAFSVALWEALGGRRDAEQLDGIAERVVRALRRGRLDDPNARFATLDDLLDELAPPPPRTRRWVIATVLAAGALVATLAFTFTRERASEPCARAGDAVAAVWSGPQRDAVRAAFAATKLPYAAKAADTTIRELDAWTADWQRHAAATCRATLVDRVQPAASHALRTACLDELLNRLRPTVALARTADAQIVARAEVLARSLPAPERCDDVVALSALPPLPPAERDRAEVATLRAQIAEYDTALLAGRAPQLREAIVAVDARARALGYLPLQARSQLLVARLASSSAKYDEAIAGYHAAARDATAARDLVLLAEIWIELSQTLGNDVRRQDDAVLFDGYAAAMIEK
ncbi:MAG TPA: protein kinase, partial [Kofleriaceae bacterium]